MGSAVRHGRPGTERGLLSGPDARGRSGALAGAADLPRAHRTARLGLSGTLPGLAVSPDGGYRRTHSPQLRASCLGIHPTSETSHPPTCIQRSCSQHRGTRGERSAELGYSLIGSLLSVARVQTHIVRAVRPTHPTTSFGLPDRPVPGRPTEPLPQYGSPGCSFRRWFSSDTYCRMSSTASSYFRPSSMSASATSTGALPSPATQCTATQAEGSARNRLRSSSSQSSTTCRQWGGTASHNSGPRPHQE